MGHKLTTGQKIYQIEIQGWLDERWSDWFDGMTITQQNNSDGSATTIIKGAVADQSALRGILTRLWDLNLTLISVYQINCQR